MSFEYIRFFEEQLGARGLKNKNQACQFIELRTGYKITEEQAWEFLSTKRESCPNTQMVKVWELAFEVNLNPRYYGADLAFEKTVKSEKKRK